MTGILLTRPMADNQTMAAALTQAGLTPCLSPVMDIVDIPTPLPDIRRYQALLLTSANGAKALARRTEIRDIKVFAVGSTTAAAARSAGFANIEQAGGNVDSLAHLIAARQQPGAALLHAAGAHRAGNLPEILTKSGFTTNTVVLYESRAVATLSADAKRQLSTHHLAGVAIFSPRSAHLFANLVKKAQLEQAAAAMVGFCLSQNCAVALQTAIPNMKTMVATAPCQSSLLTGIIDYFRP